MLQYYSHYSEIKYYFLQVKNFVSSLVLCNCKMVVGHPEHVNGAGGNRRPTETERRPCRAFCGSSWNWAQWQPSFFPVITGSTWPAKEAFVLVWKPCVWLRLSPESSKLAEEKLLCRRGFCYANLLLFQLKITVFPQPHHKNEQIWFTSPLNSSRFPPMFNMEIAEAKQGMPLSKMLQDA